MTFISSSTRDWITELACWYVCIMMPTTEHKRKSNITKEKEVYLTVKDKTIKQLITKHKALTWANKQRLIIAIGEWHHDAYKERNKFFPASLKRDFFNRSRRLANSDDVNRIKFKAWNRKLKVKDWDILRWKEKGGIW